MPQKEKNPAFVLQKKREVSIEERPLPKLESPYDVKVHVKATGYVKRVCDELISEFADLMYTTSLMGRLVTLLWRSL